MTFDTRIHFPQSQGGPNPEAVSRGCGFLFDTLHESMRFHSIPTDTALSETRNDIKNYPALLKNLQTAATWLKGCDTGTVFMLGGDCSTDVAIIDKLNAMHGKGFGFIWIDAHADIHVPQGSDSKYFHGMPIRTLLGEGDAAMLAALGTPLEHRQLCYAGIKSIDAPEADYIRQKKLPVVTAEQINAGNYTVFDAWQKNNGITALHIHFDLDALDPADGITVTYPVGAIRHTAMKEFLAYLYKQGITVGFTITEYAPISRNEAEIRRVLELISVIVPLPEILAA